jgi:predicted RNA polymerase sigma factor
MGSQVTLNGTTYRVPSSYNQVDDLQSIISVIWAHFNQHHDYTGEQYDRDSINMASSLVRTIKVLHKLGVI